MIDVIIGGVIVFVIGVGISKMLEQQINSLSNLNFIIPIMVAFILIYFRVFNNEGISEISSIVFEFIFQALLNTFFFYLGGKLHEVVIDFCTGMLSFLKERI